MNENFYLGLKARIEAGQYTMAEITAELDKRLGQGRITDEAYSELLTLAEICIDPNYNGNKMPTKYDLEQNVMINDHDLSIVDLYEMVLMSSTSTQQAKFSSKNLAMGRSIANSYVRLIIRGTRTFSSVPEPMRQEVADELIKLGREDLIDVPEYLLQEEIDPGFSVNPEEVPAE